MKKTEQNKKNQKYFFLAAFFIIALLAFLVIKPFIGSIIGGFLVAYLLWPVHKWLLKYVKNNTLSALMIGVLAVAIIVIPLTFVTINIIEDAATTADYIKKNINYDNIINCAPENKVCTSFQEFIRQDKTKTDIKSALDAIKQKGREKISSIAASIPSILINFFIFIFTVFVGLKEGESIMTKIMAMTPLSKNFKELLAKRTVVMIDANIYGSLVVAFIQGIIASIGYFAFGVESPLLWGFVTVIVALIPMVGTALVWLPLAIYFIVQAIANSDYGLNPLSHFTTSPNPLGQGIAILIWGIFIVSIIDNIIRPKIIGKRTNLHPLLVLVGILGGLQLFGPIGIIIGPVIITLFITFIEVFAEEKDELIS